MNESRPRRAATASPVVLSARRDTPQISKRLPYQDDLGALRLVHRVLTIVPAATGMHDLRHYYASLLIRQGESVKTVQRRLGHATAAETLATYSHLWPDSDDRTGEAVDAILTAVPPVCPESKSG
jgi:integrase